MTVCFFHQAEHQAEEHFSTQCASLCYWTIQLAEVISNGYDQNSRYDYDSGAANMTFMKSRVQHILAR